MDELTRFVDYLNSKELKDKDLFEQYAEMKNAQRILDERVEEINGIIFEEMDKSGEKKRVFPYGNFTLVPRITYAFSEAVKLAESRLKEQKKQEITDGVAEAKESKHLTFTGNKKI